MQRQRGQTVIEVLVAIGLSAIMLPALATALVASREGRAQESERLQATALARQADEAVRSVREKGWSNISALTAGSPYKPTLSANAWSLTAGAESVGTFTRQVVATDVQRNSSGAIVTSGGTVDPSTRKITITVSWTQPATGSVVLEDYYGRYLNNAAWTQTTQAEFAAGTATNTTATATGGGQVELAAAAGGGPSFVQTASASGDTSATTITATFPAAVAGGNLIAVAVSYNTAGSVSMTCSDNQNNTYVPQVNASDSFNRALAICYAANVAGGPTTVTVTFGAANTFRRLSINEYNGVLSASPVDVSPSRSGTATTATDNATSGAANATTANDLIFGALLEDGPSTVTISAGTGFTLRTAGTDFVVQDKVFGSTGSVASTNTFNVSERYIAAMAAFKPIGTPTDWAPPNILRSVDVAGTEDNLDVQVVGNYAYVADATILRIYDITNVATAAPTALGTYTAGGTINDLYVSGNYVYLATTNTSGEFVVVNATNKSSLTATVVNLANSNVGTAIYVANNRAYIGRALSTTNGQNEFYIYNVTTPTSPVAEGSLNLTAQVNAIYVPTATHAYLATAVTTAEISVVKIDVPASPTAAGTYDASGTSVGSDIEVVGSTVYLAKANNTSGGEVFVLTANTATPTNVTFTLNGSYEAGANVNGIDISGNLAFLATAVTNAQFSVINVSSPASITVVGSTNLAANATRVSYSGTYAFISSAHDTRELMILQPDPVITGGGGGGGYASSGTFESSTFDATVSAGFNYFTFTTTVPASTNITFQVATNNDNATWNYVGPDGTAGTSFSAPGMIWFTNTGRYFRYKATLTGPGSSTPVISDITVNYSP